MPNLPDETTAHVDNGRVNRDPIVEDVFAVLFIRIPFGKKWHAAAKHSFYSSVSFDSPCRRRLQLSLHFVSVWLSKEMLERLLSLWEGLKEQSTSLSFR